MSLLIHEIAYSIILDNSSSRRPALLPRRNLSLFNFLPVPPIPQQNYSLLFLIVDIYALFYFCLLTSNPHPHLSPLSFNDDPEPQTKH